MSTDRVSQAHPKCRIPLTGRCTIWDMWTTRQPHEVLAIVVERLRDPNYFVRCSAMGTLAHPGREGVHPADAAIPEE